MKVGDRVRTRFEDETVAGTVEEFDPDRYLPARVRWDNGNYGFHRLRDLVTLVGTESSSQEGGRDGQ